MLFHSKILAVVLFGFCYQGLFAEIPYQEMNLQGGGVVKAYFEEYKPPFFIKSGRPVNYSKESIRWYKNVYNHVDALEKRSITYEQWREMFSEATLKDNTNLNKDFYISFEKSFNKDPKQELSKLTSTFYSALYLKKQEKEYLILAKNRGNIPLDKAPGFGKIIYFKENGMWKIHFSSKDPQWLISLPSHPDELREFYNKNLVKEEAESMDKEKAKKREEQNSNSENE